ncbi:MraY family glycosyltransferase [Paenibacillus radicis (ex Xue et al. 2023)]|uniref:Undecaprenyl/decaprenyl-phosphate alpha-N-acetylglucosaminyl 1-phosphate transferase n=1 Tax=Paenibacillus radicis (ex Xue et al. 2023) TaxID=2972489 RepID=A0ABT1YJH3_9BACL|nr:MraY family glycosyltransferase [Paenibacillus radicis (ex Xue et al. 2023)]MCR8633347.1 undecaprenyl/decaprenyl-phosphate alpha-N-acetylglucosaminyl 1-phosphate transferase [Paenibacillus radicis (ex Xue et al. 2023)]
MLIVASLLISFLLSLLFTPIAKNIAIRFMILDVSNTSLKTHKINTPYLGGLSIFASVVIASAFVIFLFKLMIPIAVYGLLIACFIIIAVGFTDDIYNLHPLTKIFFQIIAASLAWLSGIRITLIGLEQFDSILTIIWIVGLSNAFNLIDIMDGLASGVAAISSIFLSLICLELGEIMNGLLLLSIAGACCGFLKFNFNPAQIFMGDTGSLFLGFLIACSTAHMFQFKPYGDIVIPVIILGIPIFETIFISLLRIKSGIAPWKGTKDHFALRLVRLGFSVKHTVLLTYLFCAFLGSVTLIFFYLGSSVLYCFFAITLILIGIGWVLSKVDISNSQHS